MRCTKFLWMQNSLLSHLQSSLRTGFLSRYCFSVVNKVVFNSAFYLSPPNEGVTIRLYHVPMFQKKITKNDYDDDYVLTTPHWVFSVSRYKLEIKLLRIAVGSSMTVDYLQRVRVHGGLGGGSVSCIPILFSLNISHPLNCVITAHVEYPNITFAISVSLKCFLKYPVSLYFSSNIPYPYIYPQMSRIPKTSNGASIKS